VISIVRGVAITWRDFRPKRLFINSCRRSNIALPFACRCRKSLFSKSVGFVSTAPTRSKCVRFDAFFFIPQKRPKVTWPGESARRRGGSTRNVRTRDPGVVLPQFRPLYNLARNASLADNNVTCRAVRTVFCIDKNAIDALYESPSTSSRPSRNRRASVPSTNGNDFRGRHFSFSTPSRSFCVRPTRFRRTTRTVRRNDVRSSRAFCRFYHVCPSPDRPIAGVMVSSFNSRTAVRIALAPVKHTAV